MANFNEIGFVLLSLLGIFLPVFLLTVVQFLVEDYPSISVITVFWSQWAPLEWWALGRWPTWPIGKSGPVLMCGQL